MYSHVGVAVAAKRDTVTSLTLGLERHTTDLDILTLGQEPGLCILMSSHTIKVL